MEEGRRRRIILVIKTEYVLVQCIALNSKKAQAPQVDRKSSADGEGSLPGGRILKWPNLKVFSFEELKSATKNFKSDTLLGEGGFGTVYMGWLDEKTLAPARAGSGMVVAIKKFNPAGLQGFEEWQVT
ncbi:serine/threonine-protein kinase Cx32 [Spatholobus suberectus]|nr:serine/threonine-protein kinase Cx32 [Spatholobus suberectus]